MRSLFVKFFLSFLLIIVLISAIGITMTYLRDQEFPPLAHQHFARQAIGEYGRVAIRAYESEGLHELQEYVEELFENAGVRLILFDGQAQPLSRQRVPRRMLRMARRALESGEVVFPMRGARNWVASPLASEAGRPYVIAIGLPDKTPSRHLVRGFSHGFLGWRLLVLLGVSALVCFWLARSLTAPIGRLRQATRQFAAGDLSTRVAAQVKGKHELAGLAQDFDEMAGQIEILVDSQQRLLRDISHELRSPLARLGVALELARQEANPAVRQKALARIELEAERMNELIGQLLSLTRLENAAEGLPGAEFDLSELLAGLVQDADFEAQKHACAVIFNGRHPVMFHGSEELLSRALENVIRNAVKYTADRSLVNVELSASQEKILIRIVDQGPGVPAEALGKLFEPFYRVADARDRQSGGTGIGLAIAERAIKLHSGRIRANNGPSGGLEVEIELPQAIPKPASGKS